MFWRVLWRLMRASRGPLALAFVAVASGAAVCAALLNVNLDAGEKLTREFRTLGANVVVSPRQAGNDSAVMEESVLARIGALHAEEIVAAAPYLYIAAEVSREAEQPVRPQSSGAQARAVPVIVAGTWLNQVARMNSWWRIEGNWVSQRGDTVQCMMGSSASRSLGLAPGSKFTLRHAGKEVSLTVAGVLTSGGSEDSQIFVSLGVAQDLAGLPGRVGLTQLSVQGPAPVIEGVNQRLSALFPDLDVRPVRQLAAAEGRLFERIRGLLFVTIFLILLLTTLGVLAAMAGLALERRRDVGLMKALGGTVQQVMRFFLVEATAIGMIGGILGCALGMLLAAWIELHVFATAMTPRLIVWPVTVALMVAVALAGAVPLRLLGRVRPAEILRNE